MSDNNAHGAADCDYGHPIAPTPTLRTFDLRTSEERLVMWCAHLEMQNEDLAGRVRHLELAMHRLLNAGEQPIRPAAKSLTEDEITGGAAVTAVAVLACLAVAVCALAYAEDRANELARERIRRQESETWAKRFEGEAETLRCENARLANQVATLQQLHSERTRELLAQNYPVIAANATWRRRRQQ